MQMENIIKEFVRQSNSDLACVVRVEYKTDSYICKKVWVRSGSFQMYNS